MTVDSQEGRAALGKALRTAALTARAARVAALVVPLATIALAHSAQASCGTDPIVGGPYAGSINGSFCATGSSGSYLDSWSIDWNVVLSGATYDYSIGFNSSPDSITEINIPMFKLGDITVGSVPSGASYSIQPTTTSNWTATSGFAPQDIVVVTGLGGSGSIDFSSTFAPTLEPYEFVQDGQTLIGDPPSPDDPVPEPGTLSLFASALFGLAALRRRWRGSGKRPV